MTSVGEILRKERLKKQLLLEQVEKELRIRKKHLEFVENNNWEFASKIYLTGILKNYARYLGLDEKKILAFFRRDYAKTEEIEFKKKVGKTQITADTTRWIKKIIFLIIISFFLYFGFQVYNYFSPPKIEIISPQTTIFSREKLIKIKGKTKPESQVNINGNEVLLDKNGNFVFDFPLEKGENKLKIEVTGPNGKKSVLEKTFFRRN